VIVRSVDTAIVGIVGPEQNVEGRAAGKATIEVRRVADTMDVARIDAIVRGPRVKFTTTITSIELGQTTVISAKLTGNAPAVMWRTSDARVLAVDSVDPTSVNLIARSIGAATIIAVGVADTTRRAAIAIGVTPVGVASIAVSPANLVLRGREMTARVFVTLRDARGAMLENRQVTVTPETPGIAEVARTIADTSRNENYSTELTVVSQGPGATKLILTIDGKRAELPVTVRFGGPDSAYVTSGLASTVRPTLNDFPGTVRITALVAPRNGTASISSTSSIDYTATAGYVGLDSLAYVAVDPSGQTDTVPVRLVVMPGPYRATPVASNSSRVDATDLSQTGEVSGNVWTGNAPGRGFRWSLSRYVLLPTASSNDSSRATAINDLGDVVGISGGRPVLWRTDATEPLDLDPNRTSQSLSPIDVNNRREVAFMLARIWREGQISNVVVAGATSCWIPAINNRGDVLLNGCYTGSPYTWWQLLLANGQGQAGQGSQSGSCNAGRQSDAAAVNDSGWVLAHAEDQSAGTYKPQLHAPGVPCVKLPDEYDPQLVSVAGLNNRGWIVGMLRSASSTMSAVLLVNGVTIPLDSLAPNPGWKFVKASRVNDAGQILAEATDGSARRAWFLLSPP
jgi:hypothetical protein